MQLVLSINLGNEAMQTPEDVAMALINSARAIQHHDEMNCKAAHIVRDRNGNTVGKWEVIEEPAKPQEVTALNAKQDQGEDRLPFDFVTSDPEPGVTRFLVVDSEGNEIAQCISEDWAIKTAEALRKYTA